MGTDEPSSSMALREVFLRPAHWQSAYTMAVQRLAQAIKLGAIDVGSRLPAERELVSSLGISRTTLREALRTLQDQGYVESVRGRNGGTFVVSRQIAKPSKAAIRRLVRELGDTLPGLFDLRESVEPSAAALAADRATAEELQLLTGLVARSKSAPTLELRQADSLLHIAIAKSAHSALLLDLVLQVQILMHDVLAFLSVVPDLSRAAQESTVEHGEIVDAIERRDSGAAQELMLRHVRSTHDIITEIAGTPATNRRTTSAAS